MKKILKVKVRVSGVNLDRLIFELNKLDIPLFEMFRDNEKAIIIQTTKVGFKKIKGLKISKFYKFKVVFADTYVGVIKKVLSCVGVVFGTFLGFLLFYFSSLNVTSVNINADSQHVCDNGDKCIFTNTNQTLLNDYLLEIGLSVGKRVKDIDPMKIERQIVAKFESLSGASIEKKGTSIFISLHEGQVKDKNSSVDIVAPENLKVLSINVSKGEAKVKSGDIAKKGQVLVKGTSSENATAVIEATLYYNSSLVYSERQIKLVETGKTFSFVNLEISGRLVNKKNYSSPFVYFNTETQKTCITDNLFVPIYKVSTTYRELVETEVVIDFDLARSDLEKKLLNIQTEKIADNLPDNYTSFFISTKIADGVYLLDCYTEVFKIISN